MAEPNDVWGADFKGEFRTKDRKYCYPLTVTDGCSRYLLACKALPSTKHNGSIIEFRRLFRKHGLLRQILTDNGVPFASQGLHGFSRLSVWWLKLGIHPIRIEPGQPSQNGRHERMHKTLKDEATRPPQKDIRSQQREFDTFRIRFNTVRPHHAIGKMTPVVSSPTHPGTPPFFTGRDRPRLPSPKHCDGRVASSLSVLCMRSCRPFWLGCPGSMRIGWMPSLSHQTERRENPCRPCEANGTPLSVRIWRGNPCLRKSRRNSMMDPLCFVDGRALHARRYLLHPSVTVNG